MAGAYYTRPQYTQNTVGPSPEESKMIEEMAMLIRMLCRNHPEGRIKEEALGYLERMGVLR